MRGGDRHRSSERGPGAPTGGRGVHPLSRLPCGRIAGSDCDCHMPERTYMVVAPRRDHSLRVPRPDLSR